MQQVVIILLLRDVSFTDQIDKFLQLMNVLYRVLDNVNFGHSFDFGCGRHVIFQALVTVIHRLHPVSLSGVSPGNSRGERG